MVAAPEPEARAAASPPAGNGHPKGSNDRALAPALVGTDAAGAANSADTTAAPDQDRTTLAPDRRPTRPQRGGAPTNAQKLAAGILAIAQMLVAVANQAADAAEAGIAGFARHKVDAARQRGLAATQVHVEPYMLQRLQLVTWVSQHLSAAAAFIAAGAGDAYSLLFRLAFRAASQIVDPWVKALREQADRGASRGSKPAVLVRALTLQASEIASLEIICAALVLAYAQVYDAFEAAARVIFDSATSAGQSYLAESYGGELAAVTGEGVQIAGHLFALTASWARLLGRAFISRPTQRRARELLLREVPGVQIEPDHDEE